MKYKKIISQMTLSEKAAFCSGADMWHLEKNDRLNIPGIMVTDGPHGLRKQRPGDQANINNSQPATCFPCSCLTAASWDAELLERIGKAIGTEARRENVAAVLGPGANIKRSPLCGRNFEYFSEDPLLSGELAAAWIKGVQTQGVGTSLKHFCANNQESYRFTENSVVDERALREIYLYPFEIAVKKAAPASLMCAYNKVGGTYCSENERLLTDILRKEWGFKGLVMSDWGATNDRVAGITAGLDLEMPGSMGVHDKQIIEAVASRRLSAEELERNLDRILEFIFAFHNTKKTSFFPEAHNVLAREAAEQSAVLLKNENGLFPYTDRDEKILVVGALAANPRYQGSGSSHINPFKLTSFIDALEHEKISYEYEPGYDLLKNNPDRKLLKSAVQKAAEYEKVIICAGLPDQFESEGFDRTSMRMPRAHDVLINEIAKVNKNIAVVIFAGAPVLMPWEEQVRAILYMYLPGQAGGSAALNLIYGKVNPCGKLPETFPLSDSDIIPSKYPGTAANVEYRESIFVGYRYYDTAGVNVRYPFGYGLSYTSFEYTAMEVSKVKDGDMPLEISVSVRNIGDREGSEIVQIYTGKENSGFYRPKKELKAFGKIKLRPGESGTLRFVLDSRSFSIYDTRKKSFAAEPGEYTIYAGASSADIRLSESTDISGSKVKTDTELKERAPWYFAPANSGIPREEFEEILGAKIPDEPEPPKKGEFMPENTILQMSRNSLMAKGILKLSKPLLRRAMKCKKHDNSYMMVYEGFRSAPIKNAALTSQGAVSMDLIKGVVTMLNGSFFGGLKEVREALKKDQGTIADD